jgi:hypothetical protein
VIRVETAPLGADITETALPGLTAARATALAGAWDDGGLWDDVCWLAQRCWREQQTQLAPLGWHHLVVAVGNFKRQSGRRLRPCRINDLPQAKATRAERFVLPSGLVIHREREETWRQLEAALPGAALATTTTLLAALWPDDHFIFDWRVEAAANALRINAGLSPTKWAEVEMEGGKRTSSGFNDYAVVRSWLKTIDDCPLRTAERALYRLSQTVKTVRGRSWPDYAKAVATKLETAERID